MSLDIASLFGVEGKVVVITGGGTGIGLMMAKALENNGATVYILGRRLEVLQKAASENAKHGKIIPLQCDVTSNDSILSAVEAISQQQGYINVLINNSGVMYNTAKAPEPTDDIKTFQKKLWEAGTKDEFNKTFEVNVTAVYYTTVAFLELLDAGNKRAASSDEPTSQVITVSSIGALRRDDKVFSLSYSASKAAVLHLAKILVNTLKRWRIRSNIIAPGIYPSEMTTSLMQQTVGQDQVILERYGKTEDMGALALFLIGKSGAYVDGGVHITDGGRLALFASSF